MKTFLCKRFPPEGKEVAPEECEKYRSMLPPGKVLTLAEKRDLANKGITGMIERMPAPCEHCKEWEALCKKALEQEEFEATQPDPEDKKKKACLECKLIKKIIGRGLCGSCYHIFRKAGTLDEKYPLKDPVPARQTKKEPAPQTVKGHCGRKKREYSREEIDAAIAAVKENRTINVAIHALGMKKHAFYRMVNQYKEIEDALKEKHKKPGKIPPALQSPEAFLKAMSEIQKPNSAPDPHAETVITINLNTLAGLHERLVNKAKEKLRTLHDQIIWELRWVLKEAPHARDEGVSRDDL